MRFTIINYIRIVTIYLLLTFCLAANSPVTRQVPIKITKIISQDVIVLENKWAKVAVDLEKSGRIVYLGSPKVNLLYLNPEVSQKADWKNHGGDFLWVGPQSSWPNNGWPPIVPFDGEHWLLHDSSAQEIIVQSPSYNGISLEKRIQLLEKIIRVTYTLINSSDESVQWGLWDITQLPVPLTTRFSFASTNNIKVFDFPANVDINDLLNKGIISSQKGMLAIHCMEDYETYKLGGITQKNEIVSKTTKGTLTKTFSLNKDATSYPDNCNIEVYKDPENKYVEVEVLWELLKMQPNTTHSETIDYSFTLN